MGIRARLLLVALVATLLAAASGTVGGWFAGRAVTLRLTEGRLARFADRLLDENENASTEVLTVAARQNASPYPFCSDAEIAYFRDLVLRSRYLKDAGRIRDGKIYCSVVLGRLDKPIAVPDPDFIGAHGSRMYRSIPGYPIDAFRALTHQRQDSYEVFSQWFLLDQQSPPFQFTLTMRDRDSSRSGALVGESPKLSASVLTHDMEARVDDILLATRCSARFIGCVTTYVPISTAVRAERGQILAFTVMGALTGASLGLLWSVLYRRNRSMDQQLRRAIRRDELRLVYQPIVDLASGRIVGAEALIRWSDDQGIPVGAEVFVALAEQKGYAGEITRLVIRHVLRDFGEVFNRCPAFRVNLNIAVSDLIDPSFLPALDEMRRQARVPAANLGIEITEGSTAHQDAAIETIRELRHAGHTVHIDDFGTGYSSLSYLAHLAADVIKIDKAFTHAIGTGSVTVGILPQILAIAETLKMAVIVEGVETREQVNYFKEIAKPVLAQGWFFGRPSPLNEFLRMLAENEKRIEYYMDSPLESKPSRAVPIRET